jgi:gliding motility-associated-like protein
MLNSFNISKSIKFFIITLLFPFYQFVQAQNINLTARQSSSNALPTIFIKPEPSSICGGGNVTFTAVVTDAGLNPVYQWKKNGNNVGTNSASYTGTFITNDVISCSLTTNASGVPATVNSNSIKMQGPTDVEPEVSVSGSATTICPGTSVTFVATNVSGNLNPQYSWTVNGNDAGVSGATFTTSSLTNGAIVQCRMTVPQCGGGTTKDYSDPITITISSSVNPTITISTNTTTICKGSSATFKAIVSNAGNNPTYQWMINGLNVIGGASEFTSSTLNDGDIVNCVITTDPALNCSGIRSATSNSLSMKVLENKPINFSISESDNNICEGLPITFSALAENVGTEVHYQWKINGINTGNDNQTYSTVNLKNKDVISCVLTAQNTTCGGNGSYTSNNVTMSLKPVPQLTIFPTDTTVMRGTEVNISALVNGDIDHFNWSPSTLLQNANTLAPQTFALQKGAVINLNITAQNGCTANKEIVIKVISKLYMPNSFTPNGDGKNDVFRIPEGVSFQLTNFSIYDRWGNKIFVSKDIQKGWDGRYKNKMAESNTYVYIIQGKDDQGETVIKGSIHLIR